MKSEQLCSRCSPSICCRIRATGEQADLFQSDLRDASSAREVARRAVELGNGHVDILINNAGNYPSDVTHETREDLFDKVYSFNGRARGWEQERAKNFLTKSLERPVYSQQAHLATARSKEVYDVQA
jgi:NAD(P)-dependent dehydrogenase (short-subunit alcohol dehydrogenase family)